MEIKLLFNFIDQCGYMIDDIKEIVVEKKISINFKL